MPSLPPTVRPRGRPRKEEFRPQCPDHPGSNIRLDGYAASWSDFHRRPRYRCVTAPGARGHSLQVAVPIRHPTEKHPDSAQECPHCEHELARHEGTKTAADFIYGHVEIADALIRVGTGDSLRLASKVARQKIFRTCKRQWKRIGPGQTSTQGHLAADYVDAYADVVLDALAPTEWPRFVAIDSMPLRTRGYRKGAKVGNLEAGEILVAVDHTQRPAVPVLMQVQGGKDADCWKSFFASLKGEPEWVLADLDSAIAKAVHETWPRAILFRSRDHLMRLMRDRALLDGVPSAIRINEPDKRPRTRRAIWPYNQPVQEFEAHPLFAAIQTCQRGPEEWAKFLALVEAHIPHDKVELRGWLVTNEPLIRVQWELHDERRAGPVGSGGVEGVIREFLGKHVKRRAGRITNVGRFNRTLALMTLNLRGDARHARYAGLLRTHFAAHDNKSGVVAWNARQDPKDERSLPRLVHDADLRQDASGRAEDRRRKVLDRLRRLQEAEERRHAAGLMPLRRRKRVGRPARQSTRAKKVSDFATVLHEWDWSLNPDKDPTRTPASSKKHAVWRCVYDPDHVWVARIFDRFNAGTRCHFCVGILVHPKESLAAEFGEIAREWHSTKNGTLCPDQVLPGSGRKVWWQCDKGHEWAAHVYSRTTHQSGCPDCFKERQPEVSRQSAKRRRQAIVAA